ncbi:MAG: TIGR01212 family radical SAM protein [Clostridiales bacterium]|nr:TIGR01212 family radical SAM protein [Clostridiales bacterium]
MTRLRYLDTNTFYRQKFGVKVYKAAVILASTCPNRDGTCGTGGCIFCSEGGSGEFAQCESTVKESLDKAIDRVRKKAGTDAKYVAYFQSFSNTYVPAAKLDQALCEAESHPDVVQISIATRPDCLPDDIMEVLAKHAGVFPLMVELGLQTANDKTGRLINRGFDRACFDDAVSRLTAIGCETAAHVIFGLPGEDTEDMMESVRAASVCTGVKFTCLYIPKNTVIEKMWRAGEVEVLGMEEYFDIVERALDILPSGCAVFRVTGDCPKKILLAPEWTANKRQVVNYINRRFGI